MASPSLTEALQQLDAYERWLVAQLGATRTALATLRGVATSAPIREPDTTRKASPVASSAATSRVFHGIGGGAVANAREHALLILLDTESLATMQLRERLPIADGMTTAQHKAAVANALHRMHVDELIAHGDAGSWTLTAKGRKAAGQPAKEAG